MYLANDGQPVRSLIDMSLICCLSMYELLTDFPVTSLVAFFCLFSQLKLLLQLNDGEGTIAGRKVQLDAASDNQNKRAPNQRRPQGDGNVDGSRFPGGKYNNRRPNNNNNDESAAPKDPKERPSLKLAPRTKPKSEEEKGDKQGPTNIFGGAKARDAQAWEENRKTRKPNNNGDNHQKADGDRRRSSQGGRGGRGGGRGGPVTGESVVTKRATQGKRDLKQKLISPEERAAAAAAKAATEAAAPAPVPAKPAAPTNKFALLMDSDSD